MIDEHIISHKFTNKIDDYGDIKSLELYEDAIDELVTIAEIRNEIVFNTFASIYDSSFIDKANRLYSKEIKWITGGGINVYKKFTGFERISLYGSVHVEGISSGRNNFSDGRMVNDMETFYNKLYSDVVPYDKLNTDLIWEHLSLANIEFGEDALVFYGPLYMKIAEFADSNFRFKYGVRYTKRIGHFLC